MELNSGQPLGISRDSQYDETHIQIAPGDTITLLSDGVVEARSASGELFGFNRTQEISGLHAEEIADTAQRFGQDE